MIVVLWTDLIVEEWFSPEVWVVLWDLEHSQHHKQDVDAMRLVAAAILCVCVCVCV